MGTRYEGIENFKSGQQSNAKKNPEPKVKVISNASNSPSADPGTGVDHLGAALAHRGPPNLPSDNHIWTHTTRVEPVGAHYNPTGNYGSVKPTGTGKGVYSYGGAPNKKGDNPLGSNSNRKGGNPLGNNSNRHGDNALGKALGGKGANAVGSPNNRKGSKSGYPKFSPKGGGRKP